MSAVDIPPGFHLSDLPSGEFGATTRSHRLARRVFFYALATSVGTYLAASQHLYVRSIEFLLVVPLVCMSVAAVGYAVRRARLRIDADGARWGWELFGFRMGLGKMSGVRAYRDAIAFKPKRGSTWYVSHRDWHNFERIPRALESANIPFERRTERAPLSARLQSYGYVLDGLLLLNALAATAGLIIALIL